MFDNGAEYILISRGSSGSSSQKSYSEENLLNLGYVFPGEQISENGGKQLANCIVEYAGKITEPLKCFISYNWMSILTSRKLLFHKDI